MALENSKVLLNGLQPGKCPVQCRRGQNNRPQTKTYISKAGTERKILRLE